MTPWAVDVPVADVWKAGRPAGRRTRTPDGVAFSYLPDYTGPAVATTLPVGPQVVLRPGARCPGTSPDCCPTVGAWVPSAEP